MTKNIYELLDDQSAEADKFIETGANFGVYRCGIKRTPRERLAKMASTLKGEEVVRDYLNEHGKNNQGGRGEFADPKRELISDHGTQKRKGDLQNTKTGEFCEVKEYSDYKFDINESHARTTAFGTDLEEPGFEFDCDEPNDCKAFLHYVMHEANYCIVINASHNKLAMLDLNSIKGISGKVYKVKAIKFVKLVSQMSAGC